MRATAAVAGCPGLFKGAIPLRLPVSCDALHALFGALAGLAGDPRVRWAPSLWRTRSWRSCRTATCGRSYGTRASLQRGTSSGLQCGGRRSGAGSSEAPPTTGDVPGRTHSGPESDAASSEWFRVVPSGSKTLGGEGVPLPALPRAHGPGHARSAEQHARSRHRPVRSGAAVPRGDGCVERSDTNRRRSCQTAGP
jgi:hypothetical protein